MRSIRISAVAGVALLAIAATAAAAADQASTADQAAAAPAPGMSAPAAPAPVMVVAGEPGTTPGQIAALRAGDNHTVTNGPVPDTAANRARFGGPRSHAGKKTAPGGN